MMLHSSTQSYPIDIDQLCADITAQRDSFHSLRHIPQPLVDGLKRAGCYRAFVPARFGGDALSPAAFCRLIERISQADASTGWVASFGVSATYLASLPVETYRQIFTENPDTVFAGAMFPPQPALRVAGGFEVTGRWPYASGVMGADLVGCGIRIDGEQSPLPRTAVMPRARVEVLPTWNSIGLAATGSHDIRVDKVVVAEDWTFIRGGTPSFEDAIFRYPAMALAAQVLAVVAIGAARAALDWLATDARGRVSITGAPSPAARAYLQMDYARAEGLYLGAKAAFYDAIEQGWDELNRLGAVSRPTHIRLRQVASKAATDSAEAARIAFVLGGSEATMTGHPLGRFMLDAACVAQHAFLGPGTWQAAGAAIFDQPCPPGFP